MNLLLVEDNEGDAALLERHLVGMIGGSLERARSLRAAVDAATTTKFDAVVLDLGLPDAWGLDTVLRFGRLAPGIPVVVLTGTQQHDFADKARRAGALGFVAKSEDMASVAGEVVMLVRSHLESVASGDPEHEVQSIDRLGRSGELVTTARLYGTGELVDVAPQVWAELVDRYGDLLDLVMEQATFRTDLHAGEHLRSFAAELGALRAAPRDLISIHTAALRTRLEAASGASAEPIMAEARLALLETMGHLAGHYRTSSLGVDPAAAGGLA
jgi:CheY-like chemotaxis protein